METNRDKNKPHSLVVLLFIAYLLLLFYLLFFSVEYGRTMGEQGYRYNLEFLKEIKRFWKNSATLGWHNVIINLAGNIVAFAPFGYFMAMLTKRGKNIVRCTVWTACFSLLIELIQLVSRVGAFDVDDIFLNTIGGFLGCLAYYMVWRPLEDWFLSKKGMAEVPESLEQAELSDNSETTESAESTENK